MDFPLDQKDCNFRLPSQKRVSEWKSRKYPDHHKEGESVITGLQRRFKEKFVRLFNVQDFLSFKREDFSEESTSRKWTDTNRLFIGTATDFMLDSFRDNPKSLFLDGTHGVSKK